VRRFRRLPALAFILLMLTAASPRDRLSRARELYNQGKYDAAIDEAAAVVRTPDLCDGAELVVARASLERFRATHEASDRQAAGDALKQVRASALSDDDRVELLIAMGEWLYFDGQPGAAAEQFELALARGDRKRPERHERLLDWWATALDRESQSASEPVARMLQARIVRRMEDELRDDSGATAASYWLAAAARGSGDIQRAWDAAIAGWVRLSALGAKAAGVRADLDELVAKAIIPDRARILSPSSPETAAAAMRMQWTALKRAWS